MVMEHLLFPLHSINDEDYNNNLQRPVCCLDFLSCGGWLVIGSTDGEVLFMKIPQDASHTGTDSVEVNKTHCDRVLLNDYKNGQNDERLDNYSYRIVTKELLYEYKAVVAKMKESDLQLGKTSASSIKLPVTYDKVVQITSLFDHLLILPNESSSLLLLNDINDLRFVDGSELTLRQLNVQELYHHKVGSSSTDIVEGIIDCVDVCTFEATRHDCLSLVGIVTREDSLCVCCLSEPLTCNDSSARVVCVNSFDQYNLPKQYENSKCYPPSCIKFSLTFNNFNVLSTDDELENMALIRVVAGFGVSVTVLDCTLKKDCHGYNIVLSPSRIFSAPSSSLITTACIFNRAESNGVIICAGSTTGTIFLWGCDRSDVDHCDEISRCYLLSIIEDSNQSITDMILVKDVKCKEPSRSGFFLTGDSKGCINLYIPSDTYYLCKLTHFHNGTQKICDDLVPLEAIARMKLQGDYRTHFTLCSFNQDIVIANEVGEIKYFSDFNIPHEHNWLSNSPNDDVVTPILHGSVQSQHHVAAQLQSDVKDKNPANSTDECCIYSSIIDLSSNDLETEPVPRTPLDSSGVYGVNDDISNVVEDICPRNVIVKPIVVPEVKKLDFTENKMKHLPITDRKANTQKNSLKSAMNVRKYSLGPSELSPIPLSKPSLNSSLVEKQLIESKKVNIGHTLSHQKISNSRNLVATVPEESESKVIYDNLIKIGATNESRKKSNSRKVRKQVDSAYLSMMKQVEPKLEDFIDDIPIDELVSSRLTVNDIYNFDRDLSYKSDEAQNLMLQQMYWKDYYSNLSPY